MTSHEWQPSVFLNGDITEKITKIKQQEGPDLHVYGSANLVQTLIKHDLVDAFWLKIFPITLGGGKRLFADGTIPAATPGGIPEFVLCLFTQSIRDFLVSVRSSRYPCLGWTLARSRTHPARHGGFHPEVA